MRRLWFGGSFNPIHHGHLICAMAVAETAGFERIVLVPSASPPHKPPSVDLATAADRLAMCRLAVAGMHRFEIDDLELRRNGPSYTIDTARQLAANGNQAGGICWLIGSDTLPQLLTWHEPEKLISEVLFVVAQRPGSDIDWDRLPDALRPLKKNVVRAPQIDISATWIRRRVAAGLSIDFLTPEPVCRYIRDAGLYRQPVGAKP